MVCLFALAAATGAAAPVRAASPEHPPALLTTINLADQDYIDWSGVLANPGNVAWDEIGSLLACPTDDRDCRATLTRAQDLRRFAWTYDTAAIYFYLERQDTVASTASYFVYLDEDGDGLMETGERVVQANWLASRNIDVRLVRYTQSAAGGDSLEAAGTQDGRTLPGTISGLTSPDPLTPPPPSPCTTCGSADGRIAEFGIPWSALSAGGPRPSGFNVHVSSTVGLAGGTSTVAPADVRDNMGLSAITRGVEVSATSASISVPPGAAAQLAFEIEQLGNVRGGEVIDLAAHSETGLAIEIWRDQVGGAGVRLGRDANGDGDFADPDDDVAPGADTDGDGWPDTILPLPHGAVRTIVLAMDVPADAAGFVDRATLLARPALAPARLERARVALHSGPVTIETDSLSAAEPGESAHHLHVVTNHGAAPVLVDLRAVGGWTYTFADGATGDCRTPLPDTNANGMADVLVDPGRSVDVLACAAVPAGATPGVDVDRAIVVATPEGAPESAAAIEDVTEARRAASLVFPFDGFGALRTPPAAPNSLVYLPHELVNATPGAGSAFLAGLVPMGGVGAIAFFTDPNGDGNPDDGQRIPDGTRVDVPANGGRFPFVAVGLVMGMQAVGTTVTVEIDAFPDWTGTTVVATNVVAVERGMMKRSPTWEVNATAYGPCEGAYSTFGALRTGPVTFTWSSPGGNVRTQGRWADAFFTPLAGFGTARDARPHGAGDPTGTWRVTVGPDGVGWDYERSASLAPAVPELSADLAHALFGTRVTLTQQLADLRGARLLTTVLTAGAMPGMAGGSVLVSSGDSAALVPYDGMAVTHARPLPRIEPRDWFDDRFGVRNVDWGAGGDFTAWSTLVSACGDVIATARQDFSASLPGSEDLLRNDDISCLRDAADTKWMIFRLMMDPALDPVRDLYQAGATSPVIIPGEAVTVGQQCPQVPLGGSGRVLTFYELTTPVESLRVRKIGIDVEVSW